MIAKGAFDRGISPARMAETRVAVALVPLAIYLVLRRRDLLRPPKDAGMILVAFGVSIVIVNYAYYLAIDRLDVGVAISLQYTAPVIVLIGTALVLRQAPAGVTWIAAAATLAGAFLVSGAYAGLASIDGIGLLAGITAAITFATYLVTAEMAGRRGTHPATSLFMGFVVAFAVWSVVLPVWDWPFELLADPQVSLRVLAVGLLGTLIPFLLAVAALRIISAGVAAIASTTEPLFASVLAFVLLGLVIAGVLVAQARRRPTPASVPVEVTP